MSRVPRVGAAIIALMIGIHLAEAPPVALAGSLNRAAADSAKSQRDSARVDSMSTAFRGDPEHL